MSAAEQTQRTTQGTAQWGQEPPEGYTLQSADIPEELSAGYYEACAQLGRLGVPGIEVTETERSAAIEGWKSVDSQVKALVTGAGGDASRGYRIRHTEGKVDFLTGTEGA